MSLPEIALLHYSAPPVVGGVESVILAHARLLVQEGYPLTILAGAGDQAALPAGCVFRRIDLMDTRHPRIVEASRQLEQGRLPEDFEALTGDLADELAPLLDGKQHVIIHNIFTKHFNLALTAALFRLLDRGVIQHCIAWCHDFTWTSPHSRSRVFDGYPWDMLRTMRPDVTYVTVSQARQSELAGLFACPVDRIGVVYNGVDPQELLGLSPAVSALAARLGLWESDLNLLMPVRITQAKNIELSARVAAVLKERGLDLRLVVSGPPDPHDPENMEYFESLRSLRARLGVEDALRFVYEEGPRAGEPFYLEGAQVGELYRLSDALFMPSRREGFGMPILEAGLLDIPIFCAQIIPAAAEIGREDVIQFDPDADPETVADLILAWADHSARLALRRRVRRELTWERIFVLQILPLLAGKNP